MFADAYAKYQAILQPDAMVMVIGKGEVNGDALKILVNEVYLMDKVLEKFTKSVTLSINVNDVKENTIVQLREVMEKNRGNCPCYLNVRDTKTTKVFQLKKFAVEPTDRFLQEIGKMLGPKNVKRTS